VVVVKARGRLHLAIMLVCRERNDSEAKRTLMQVEQDRCQDAIPRGPRLRHVEFAIEQHHLLKIASFGPGIDAIRDVAKHREISRLLRPIAGSIIVAYQTGVRSISSPNETG
jgi:hypothetical protein